MKVGSLEALTYKFIVIFLACNSKKLPTVDEEENCRSRRRNIGAYNIGEPSANIF